jgi:hypothetical protein
MADEVDNGTYTCKVSDGINEIQRQIQLYVLRKFVLTLFIMDLCCMSAGPVFAHGTTRAERTVGATPPPPRYIKI